MHRFWMWPLTVSVGLVLSNTPGSLAAAEPDAAYYRGGPLSGSLKSDKPLPIYAADADHLWNRLFAAFYIRPSNIPDAKGGRPVARIEGGDVIDFFGWAKTTYWDQPAVTGKLNSVLDEFLKTDGSKTVSDPLKRAVMLRDLWAAYDYFVGQNIRRAGSLKTRKRRDALCRKLAKVIQTLALSKQSIEKLPDNYAAALKSGNFVTTGRLDPDENYLPPGLMAKTDEWVEIEFFQPDIHEDLSNRFITLHTRSYRARSYFRVFYRFPQGRSQLVAYLKQLDAVGVDWKRAAQNGFIFLKEDTPQIPVGTEVALVQSAEVISLPP